MPSAAKGLVTIEEIEDEAEAKNDLGEHHVMTNNRTVDDSAAQILPAERDEVDELKRNDTAEQEATRTANDEIADSTDTEGSEAESQESSEHEAESPLYGLFPETTNREDVHSIIVVVHGICHTPWTTELRDGSWSPYSGTKPSTSWVCDRDKSGHRVLHYHYNIDGPVGDEEDVLGPGGIEREAQKLIDSLMEEDRRIAEADAVEHSPPSTYLPRIMFVSHDIGGIIVKKALVIASMNPKKYPDMLYRCALFFFLGCPHGGEALTIRESITRLLLATDRSISEQVTEAAIGLTHSIQRINAEFLDTKILLHSLAFNVISAGNTTKDWGNNEGHPSGVNNASENGSEQSNIHKDTSFGPFRFHNCMLNLPTTLGAQIRVPHLELGARSKSSIYADTYDSDIERLNAAIDPSALFAIRHKLLLSNSAPPIAPDWADYERDPFRYNSLIKDHDEYNQWRDSSGLRVLHIRFPHLHTKLASEKLYVHLLGDIMSTQTLFFAFSANDARFNSIERMICSFLSQIAEHTPNYGFMAHWKVVAAQRGWTIRDLLQLFWADRSAMRTQRLIFFVSSLDECDTTLYQFLEFIRAMHGLYEQQVKFIITTTAGGVEDIQSKLAFWPTIDAESLKPTNENSFTATNAEKKKELQIRRILELRPNLARFQMQIRELLHSCGNETRLADIFVNWACNVNNSSSSIRSVIEASFPLTYKSLATAILKSFGSRIGVAQQILSWIRFAFETPTVWELGEALYTAGNFTEEEDSLEDIDYNELYRDIDHFAGFLRFNRFEVDFCHPSYAERVSTPNESTETHAGMASTCLRYLSLQSVQEKLRILAENCVSLEESPASLPRHSLAIYAVKYWPKHYLLAGPKSPKALAIKFFENFEIWNSWAQCVYVLSNPITRIQRSYFSCLPIISMFGLDDLVAHQTETQLAPGSPQSTSFLVDIRLALVEAAMKGHTTTVQLLVDASSPEKNALSEALLAAAAAGDETSLRCLINLATSFAEFEWPPDLFHRVAWLGLTETARLLLASGVSVPQPEGTPTTSSLHLATRGGHEDMVRLLLDADSDPNYIIKSGVTPLHLYAATGGKASIGEMLLSAGAHVGPKDKAGITPLQVAAMNGEVQVVRLLLEAKADPNDGDETLLHSTPLESTWTAKPLFLAAMNGHNQCLKLLLDFGADVTAKLDKRTALWYAASKGNFEICQMLLEKGADPNENPEGFDPLILEVISSSHKPELILKLLVLFCEFGAQFDLQDTSDSWRSNALSRAAGTGQRELVEFLLDHGVPPDLGVGVTQTPMYVAAWEGFTDIMDLLLSRGADVNLKGEEGWAPLHAAYDDAEVIKFLLDKGADIDLLSDSGTAVYLAAKHGFFDSLRALLGHKTKPNVDIETVAGPDNKSVPDYEDGMTALCIACKGSKFDCIGLLLHAGANPNHRPKDNSFPLLLCLESGPSRSIESILGFRPDLSLADHNGDTVLHHITSKTSRNTIRILYTAGANIHAVNLAGQTPLMKAILANNRAVATFLISRGADVNAYCADSGTILNMAAKAGNWNIFKAAIDAGADVTIASSKGFKESVLYSAVSGKSLDDRLQITEYLIEEAKVDPNEPCPEMFETYPLIACVSLCKRPYDLVAYLLDHGSDPKVADGMGRTALHFAVCVYWGLIELLVQRGADPMARTKVGMLPLHFATTNNEAVQSMTELLRMMGDTDAEEKARSESDEVVNQEKLSGDVKAECGGIEDSDLQDDPAIETIGKGEDAKTSISNTDGSIEVTSSPKLSYDINDKDADGWTPLMWAVRHNEEDADCVQFLLDHGADLWVTDTQSDRKWTPLKIARYFGAYDPVLELLTPKEQTRVLDNGDEEEWDDRIHEQKEAEFKRDVWCEYCLLGIVGIRWQCRRCDFNLCYKCVRRKEALHPGHEFQAIGPEYGGEEAPVEEEDIIAEEALDAYETMEHELDDGDLDGNAELYDAELEKIEQIGGLEQRLIQSF
ncbi:hypothetical protein EsH8_V_001051 [Colletotrichum jinshuiense]